MAMKRSPLRRGLQAPDFAITRDDVLLFRVDRLNRDWLMGSVVTDRWNEVTLETTDLARHRVPRDARHLRLPDTAQICGYQHDAEMARHGRAMALPRLSAAVVVRTGGAPAAVPKRRRRYRSEDYLAHVRSLPAADGGSGPVEAHHVNERGLGGDRGVGQRTDDYDCVPLSKKAHQHLTRTRRLPGMGRAATERTLLRALAQALKAWIVKNEAPAAAPEIDADERLAAALDGQGLRRLAAVAGVLLVLLLASPALAGLDRPLPPEPAAPAELLLARGRVQLRVGRAKVAEHFARRALALPRYPARAYVLLGDALAAQDKCPAARTEYLRALEALPEDPDARAGFCRCGGDLLPGGRTCPPPAPPETPPPVAQGGRP